MVTDENLADKRHAQCHTNMFAAMAEEMGKVCDNQHASMVSLKDDVLKCISDNSAIIAEAAAKTSDEGGTSSIVDAMAGILFITVYLAVSICSHSRGGHRYFNCRIRECRGCFSRQHYEVWEGGDGRQQNSH